MKVTIRFWLRSSPTSSSIVTNLSPSTSLRWVKLESKQSWPSHRQPVHVNNVISWIVCVAKDPSKYKHGRILSLVSQHFSFKVQNNSFLKIWSSTISINTKLYLWGTGSQNIYHQRFCLTWVHQCWGRDIFLRILHDIPRRTMKWQRTCCPKSRSHCSSLLSTKPRIKIYNNEKKVPNTK